MTMGWRWAGPPRPHRTAAEDGEDSIEGSEARFGRGAGRVRPYMGPWIRILASRPPRQAGQTAQRGLSGRGAAGRRPGLAVPG